jgi:hypothetical protein
MRTRIASSDFRHVRAPDHESRGGSSPISPVTPCGKQQHHRRHRSNPRPPRQSVLSVANGQVSGYQQLPARSSFRMYPLYPRWGDLSDKSGRHGRTRSDAVGARPTGSTASSSAARDAACQPAPRSVRRRSPPHHPRGHRSWVHRSRPQISAAKSSRLWLPSTKICSPLTRSTISRPTWSASTPSPEMCTMKCRPVTVAVFTTG